MTSPTYIQVQWTSGQLDEARRIARFLVEERLAACVQIIPQIESYFRWKGKVESENEVKIVVKTRHNLYDRVRALIEKEAEYEVSEITYLVIGGGNSAYLEWLDQSLA